MRQRRERNIVIEWGDVKDRFMRCVRHGEAWPSQPAHASTLAELHADPYRKQEWYGGSGADTLDWMDNGYFAESFAHSAEYVPQAEKRRPLWSEEDGDVDLGRMYGGYDDFMLDSQKREGKPGLRLMIEFAFACGVSNKTIEEYGAWVAGLIGSLEQHGFDLTVDLWIPLDNLYNGDAGVRSNVLVRVKRENEVSDFTEWSVLFSPTGYRHVGFTAKCVAGDKIGMQATYSLGQTIGGKTWGVDYDAASGTVKITVDQRASDYYGGNSFPKEKLTEQAQAAGLLPQTV